MTDRTGYTVALFIGSPCQEVTCVGAARHDEQLLVEIYEQHRVHDVPSYHYRAYDLGWGCEEEQKTIGYVDFDPESDEAPRWMSDFFPCLNWRRLR